MPLLLIVAVVSTTWTRWNPFTGGGEGGSAPFSAKALRAEYRDLTLRPCARA